MIGPQNHAHWLPRKTASRQSAEDGTNDKRAPVRLVTGCRDVDVVDSLIAIRSVGSIGLDSSAPSVHYDRVSH